MNRLHAHVSQRPANLQLLSDDVAQAIAQGLRYISYAMDAYAPATGEDKLRDANVSVDGSSAGHTAINPDAWLEQNGYSPIVDPSGNDDPINKYYGVCTLLEDEKEIIVAFRGTVFFDGNRDRPWWHPYISNINLDEFAQYLAGSFQINGTTLRFDALPGFVGRNYGADCSVNSVFTGIVERVTESIGAFLEVYGRSATSITFCGHSLGGALAQVAAMDYLARYAGNHLGGLPVKLVTYASPKVGDTAYVNALASRIPEAYHFVNANDPVPKLYAQGVSISWRSFTLFGKYLPGYPLPSGVQYTSMATPIAGLTTLINDTCRGVFGPTRVDMETGFTEMASAHNLPTYRAGLLGYGTNTTAWTWSTPAVVGGSASAFKPNGDWACTTFTCGQYEYLVVAFRNGSGMLQAAVYTVPPGSAPNAGSWAVQPATTVAIASTQGVQLVSYGGRIVASWVDGSNNIQLGELGLDGQLGTTTNVTTATQQTSDRAPSMYTGNGKLYLVYREDSSGSRPIWTLDLWDEAKVVNGQSTVSMSYGTAVVCDKQDNIESQDTPAVASVQGVGAYMAWRGASSGSLYWGTDPLAHTATDGGWNQNSTSYSSKEPVGVALWPTRDTTFAVIGYKSNGSGSSALYFAYHDLSNSNNTPVQVNSNLSSGTNNAVTLVNFMGEVYMFYTDGNNHSNLSYSKLS